MRWRRRLRLLGLPSDLPSRVALLRAALGRGGVHAVRLKALGGRPVYLRGGTTDVAALGEGVLEGFGDPPAESPATLRTVVEIGTNIGIGLALLAARNPEAQVYGVEADPDNFALAQRNLAAFGERVRVIHAAAWVADGAVELRRDGRGATGFEVVDGAAEVPARSLSGLLDDLVGGADVDYLYLDVEGAHARILQGPDTAWARQVRTIKVAGHDRAVYDELACARDLQRLGFTTRIVGYDPIGWTVGVRTARAQMATS